MRPMIPSEQRAWELTEEVRFLRNTHIHMRNERLHINTGPVIFGPAATKWYGLLTKHVNFKSTNGTIVARVACDQLLFAPVNMGTSSSVFLPPNPYR
jgi:hypothetical protein